MYNNAKKNIKICVICCLSLMFEMNNEKKINEKTRKIIAISILVFGLIVAFVIYGIKPKEKVDNEAKIITYLREKYPESDIVEESMAVYISTNRSYVRNGAKLIAPVEEGIRGLELANAMMLSGFLKKPVELPIDSKVYAEQLEKLIATSRYTKKPVAIAGNAAGFGNSF